MIKREFYLKRIRESYDSDLIKVITGVRRCGKSILLNQIIEELKKKGIKDDHIVYINFENYDYIDFTNNPKLFHDYVKHFVKDKEKYYLFFDEIQNVFDFEKVLNSFRATLNVSIFITGSNSKLLSGELATHLSGRYISYKVFPFTYKEMIELKKQNNQVVDENTFKEFLKWGGMPQIYSSQSDIEKKIYLRDLYNAILLVDIVERHKIKDTSLLNRIIQFIMENIGGIISSNSIVNYLKHEKIPVTIETVYSYIDYINESFLVNKVNRYDIRGKAVLATYEKQFMADLGFLQLKKSPIEEKIGGRLENIVYNELVSRGYEVYIGKTIKGEIDFVVDCFGERKYIQVADYLSSEEVVNREFKAYDNVKDNYPKYVITMDKVDYSRNGIKHLNIVDFLLSEEF